jgi:hypothetical protein
MKGSNCWTEPCSALQAAVPDLDDPNTLLNTSLINKLKTEVKHVGYALLSQLNFWYNF